MVLVVTMAVLVVVVTLPMLVVVVLEEVVRSGIVVQQ